MLSKYSSQTGTGAVSFRGSAPGQLPDRADSFANGQLGKQYRSTVSKKMLRHNRSVAGLLAATAFGIFVRVSEIYNTRWCVQLNPGNAGANKRACNPADL